MKYLVNLTLVILILALLAGGIFFLLGTQKKKSLLTETSLAPVSLTGGQATFEKINPHSVEVSLVTQPASAQVVWDGVPKGFTPLKLSEITVGRHQVSLVYPGYRTRTFKVDVWEGYRVNLLLLLESSTSNPSHGDATVENPDDH